MTKDIEAILWTYIRENYLPRGIDTAFNDDENLFDKGIIDSAGLISFVIHVEQRFGLTIPDEDLLPENFSTVRDIADYIRQRTGVLPPITPLQGVKNGKDKEMRDLGS
ncbi:MAG: acyl carrier protein [Deltaproteobacteria bacterium]|nr:acyl carrier protein [Deltaproteobacteria bacterium]NIS77097.1 acyl carrier protein [Deltaproteobacteria bacterium]